MKEQLLELLICPACLPTEVSLIETIIDREGNDILSGDLRCPHCRTAYRIADGIAFLDPAGTRRINGNKYELDEVVSSYLWSHYGDLIGDENSSNAYQRWSEQIRPNRGLALDLGGSVGRFTFELAQKFDFAVGIDNSVSFIRHARMLMQEGEITVRLKEEGRLTRSEQIRLPASWREQEVEFIVADAMKLPFRTHAAAAMTSLNLIDKLPSPLDHLREMNRVCRLENAQFLLSDPFSWSEEATPRDQWLGGQEEGPYAGSGLANIRRLLVEGEEGLSPGWQEEENGHVWWKIRTHRNHYELIRSCYVKAGR